MNIFRMMRIAAGVEKLRNDPKKKFRKGYSLAELILGAAVIAAFLVRIYQAYAATSDADKFQDFTSEVGLINGTVHQDFINTSSYAGLAASNISGTLPRKYTDPVTGNVVTVYQSIVNVAPAIDLNGVADGAFSVEVSIPQSDCVKALLGDMGRNLDAIDVNTAATTEVPVNVPYNGTTADVACAAGSVSNGNVPLTYYFH